MFEATTPEAELVTTSAAHHHSLRTECIHVCPKAEEMALTQHHGGIGSYSSSATTKKCYKKCRYVSMVGSYKGKWRFHAIPCSKCKSHHLTFKKPKIMDGVRRPMNPVLKKAVERSTKRAEKVIKAKKIAKVMKNKEKATKKEKKKELALKKMAKKEKANKEIKGKKTKEAAVKAANWKKLVTKKRKSDEEAKANAERASEVKYKVKRANVQEKKT